jgi:hypothetical protein
MIIVRFELSPGDGRRLYAGLLPVGNISRNENAIEMPDRLAGAHSAIGRQPARGQAVDSGDHRPVDHNSGNTVGAPEMAPGDPVVDIGSKDKLQYAVLRGGGEGDQKYNAKRKMSHDPVDYFGREDMFAPVMRPVSKQA